MCQCGIKLTHVEAGSLKESGVSRQLHRAGHLPGRRVPAPDWRCRRCSMNGLHAIWRMPVDAELWLILAYVTAVLIGARVVEALAKFHFARGRRYAEQGFEHVAPQDNRSLAPWSDTDLGRFYQHLSELMFGAGGMLSLAGIWHWHSQPGSGYVTLALIGSLACLTM